MAKNLDDMLAALPDARRVQVEQRALELATLKDLRLAVQQTQAEMAATLNVGQDTISRLEKRSDCCFPPCAAISKAWAEN
ncbi:MAG: helix-turn-helix transcriptional regulator [Gallionella sp.]|nr:helix-turn-helix transcriptional regulator [Gallionella sp.]MDD4959270.1 helix-turn-helix transcriptional regulator [Gallionella sp.]